MYWQDNYPEWEPSEADELFEEIKSKIVSSAKESVKNDFEYLKSRNEYLEKRNDELENAANEVLNKSRELKYKEDNLRREVERDFYKTSIDDLFNGRLEDSFVWYPENVQHFYSKCDLCDSERNLIHIFPNGQQISVRCNCSKTYYCYEPNQSFIKTFKYKLKNSDYTPERYYRFEGAHVPNSYRIYDDYSYSEFKLQLVYDEFCDEIKDIWDELKWGHHIGFKTKEERQKCCDWLNNRKDDEEE